MKLLWSNLSLGGLYTDANADCRRHQQWQRHTTDRAWLHRLITKWAKKLKSVLVITEILIFQVSSQFSMKFFKNLNFHGISMTGKVGHFSRCCVNPARCNFRNVTLDNFFPERKDTLLRLWSKEHFRQLKRVQPSWYRSWHVTRFTNV